MSAGKWQQSKPFLDFLREPEPGGLPYVRDDGKGGIKSNLSDGMILYMWEAFNAGRSLRKKPARRENQERTFGTGDTGAPSADTSQ